MARYQHPELLFNKYSLEYSKKYMDVEIYQKSLDILCDLISTPNGTLLDIGCGPGNLTKYILNKFPDLRATGIDLAEKMLELAKTNNPSATFLQLDAKNIHRLNSRFDVIVCGFCLPYLSKPDALDLLDSASNMLNDHGLLYISTMIGISKESKFIKSSTGDELLTYFHQSDFIEQTIQQNNLSIINKYIIETQNNTGMKDLVLVARK